MSAEDILDKIVSIDQGNIFLRYIVTRLQSDDYRGWHVSQHNRFTMDDVEIMLNEINSVAKTSYFAIPPGDYAADFALNKSFKDYNNIVNQINSKMGKGTINSVKKTFFPDLERMGFLKREKLVPAQNSRKIPHGKLTSNAVEFLDVSNNLIEKYKKFTDGIDKLFGSKMSDLAEIIHLSDYANDVISIYEFMFILSDNSDDLDKIKLLDSYRSLKNYHKEKVTDLIKQYANPENFSGTKKEKRDFHNWKNESQQIMNLLKTTVYFEVFQNREFRLNGSNTGFFQSSPRRRSTPKREYFNFHEVQKREKFELHHIVPISSARNQEEAKNIDDYRNLIYIHRKKHKRISRNRDRNVILTIDPNEAIFSDFENAHHIKAINEEHAAYSRDARKIEKLKKHNKKLIKSIFDFIQSQ